MARSSACAVDDLLEELDGLLSSPVTDIHSTAKSTAREPPSSFPRQPDDLDSLLAEMGPSPTKPARATRKFPPPSVPSSTPPVSASNLSRNESNMGGESRYRCSKCDFKVLEFEDNVWDSTVDYMFFRNYVPNCEKLSAKLKPKEGKSALACQCAWASIESFVGKVPHDYWFKER